jgi:hypothetical protein
MSAGAAMPYGPWSGRRLTGSRFLGFIFLLDPLNARFGDESVFRLRAGKTPG